MVPETFRSAESISLRKKSEEEDFTAYISRIPVVGEELSFIRESNGGRISYTYQVFKVQIQCYLQPIDRNEHISNDANITAILMSAINMPELDMPRFQNL
ncbi:MAG: hypothetical protein ACIWVG_32025 [Gloeotrichia echinulata HAB0833]